MNHDEIFRAMADPNRRRIVTALCRGPLEAGALARLVGLAPNAVSFHLRGLKAADLATVKRSGRNLVYHLTPDTLSAWMDHVHTLFPPVGLDGEMVRQKAAAARTAQRPEPPRDAEPMREDTTGSDQLPTELL